MYAYIRGWTDFDDYLLISKKMYFKLVQYVESSITVGLSIFGQSLQEGMFDNIFSTEHA